MAREYFYTIDRQGNVLHEGTIIDDADFIDYFFKQLGPNTTSKYSQFPYLSQCNREKNYVHVIDCPIVFHHLSNGNLFYGKSLSVEFSREKLRFSNVGILYHEAPIGNFGRLIPQVAMEISRYIQPFGIYYSYQDSTSKYPWIIEPIEAHPEIKILRPRAGNNCAGCGQDNPNGLYLSFLFNTHNSTADSWLVPDSGLEGSLGIMHGGYVSLLLDEVMGKVLSGMGIKAPTGNLNVRFRKPTPIGKVLHLHGKFIENNGRKYFLKSALYDENSLLLAEAEGLFIKYVS
ncbi:MAG: DUF4505 family protein [Ignavibacteria bacterium]|nr:DUF4505 family protein [Ignavibacteria bacterium]